jgi:uncharacterized protein YqjF (DUF2071 family)
VRQARPPFLPPIPLVSTFHEVNVRTYVHFEGRDPGVFFFSLDAASALAVKLARAWFHLPYYHAAMRSFSLQGNRCDYTSRRRDGRGDFHVIYEVGQDVGHAEPGSFEHFVIERYVLYATDGRSLYQGRVHHSPYPLRDAQVRMLDESLTGASGLMRPERPPHVLFSRGVDTEIFALKKI